VIDLNNCTFGAEYEYGDVCRTECSPGMSWNDKDYSIVSSTGIANDPKGLVYKIGAEINSAPSDTIEEQLSYFQNFLKLHPESKVNHRTNLHLHIHVPGLSEDLDSLKKLLRYIDANQAAIYAAIEPVPVPQRGDYPTGGAYRGARKRYKRRLVSHQYAVSPARVEEAQQASTVKQFFDAHSRKQANGGRAYGLTTRAGINLLQLQETNTVEFRHFTNTLIVTELESCFQWVANFIPAALDNAPVSQLLSAYSYKFPEFQPYNHAMEVGYSYTNFQHNSRRVVTQRLESLRKTLNIEECTAEEVVAAIKQSDPTHVAESA
jgi:hypothetical protein